MIGENNKEQASKTEDGNSENYKVLTRCPYCQGSIIKKGLRKKKYESVQVYYCKNCNKKFTPTITKHKTYPLKVIMDSLSLYNRLNPTEKIPEIIKEKYGIQITSRIISDWLKEYSRYTPFLRMREFAAKKYDKTELIEESKLFYQQAYNFKYHRGELD